MTTVTIDQVRPGMVTNIEVRDRSGRLLLGKGAEVEDRHIRLFRSWGVSGIEVCDTAAPQDAAEEAAFDPQILKRAESLVRERFQHLTMNHPAIRELFRLAVLRQARSLSGGS